ncbi:MAG: DUF5679 domain-containing protein [bacterium]|nr:DUF5679 domain-containing protein [bacterium]
MPANDKPEPVIAYCVKCREKRTMIDPKEVTMKGKGGVTRRAMTGTCEKCGTKMFKILGNKKS